MTMKLKEIRKVLDILVILYKDRSIKNGKVKLGVYKLYNSLKKELDDAIEVNYNLYEQIALRDKDNNIIMKPFNSKLSNVEVELEDGKKAYHILIKSGIKEATILIHEKDLESVTKQSIEILNDDYVFEGLNISFDELMECNISCDDIDYLLSIGIINQQCKLN